MTAPSSHAVLGNYGLPLARPRAGSAAAVSVVVHVAVALAVLWRGAVWLDGSGGGSRPEGQAAVSWVVVPPIVSPQAETSPTPTRLAGPTVTPPRVERVNLALPPQVLANAQPIALPAAIPAPLPRPVGIDEGVSGGAGREPSCGAGSEVVFGPTPLLVPTTPAEAVPDDQRTHDVQFWVRADGRVKRIVVSPSIRDWEYGRRFREAMSTFVFGPVRTPDGRAGDYVYNCVVYP